MCSLEVFNALVHDLEGTIDVVAKELRIDIDE